MQYNEFHDCVVVFDDIFEQWLPMPANLNHCEKMVVEGLEVNVINLYDLIQYKSLLNEEHQQSDIQAVREYINRQTKFHT